jgi:hypothetical protein
MATLPLEDWKQGKKGAAFTPQSVTSCREILMSKLQENVALLKYIAIYKGLS